MMLKTMLMSSLAAVAHAQAVPDLNAALSGTPELSQLATLIGSIPGLGQTLGGATNITILAPSNAALGPLLNSTAGRALAGNPGAVTALLQYHVLAGTIFGSQVKDMPAFVPSLLTNMSYANVTGGQRVGAQTVGGNVTFLSGLLQNSTVTTANQNFTGGTIHIIDEVLTLPTNASSTLVSAGLSAVYGALNSSNLLNAVDGLRDVTIFAPNNAAFQNIGSALPNISAADLTSILTYHVVNGSSPGYSSDLMDNAQLTSLQGTPLTVRIRGGNVFVNGARVVTPNVLIAGGVVHVIDNVLNPGNATATVPDNASTGAPAFSGASSASNIPFTSGVPSATRSVGTATSSAGGVPMKTGAIGAAALFGGAAMLYNM